MSWRLAEEAQGGHDDSKEGPVCVCVCVYRRRHPRAMKRTRLKAASRPRRRRRRVSRHLARVRDLHARVTYVPSSRCGDGALSESAVRCSGEWTAPKFVRSLARLCAGKERSGRAADLSESELSILVVPLLYCSRELALVQSSRTRSREIFNHRNKEGKGLMMVYPWL